MLSDESEDTENMDLYPVLDWNDWNSDLFWVHAYFLFEPWSNRVHDQLVEGLWEGILDQCSFVRNYDSDGFAMLFYLNWNKEITIIYEGIII